MKKQFALLGVLLCCAVAPAQVFNCYTFVTTATSCGVGGLVSGSGSALKVVGTTNGVTPTVSGGVVTIAPSGGTHYALSLMYQTAVNIEAFTTVMQFVSNNQNIAFTINNCANNGSSGFGTCGGFNLANFSSGASCEGGFSQAFSGNPFPYNVFALMFDQYALLTPGGSTFTYSSAQIYQTNQSPCNPSSGGLLNAYTDKFSTSPVAMDSPAGTQGTTTGHTYSATLNYDGSSLNLCLIDVTVGGSTCNSTGTSGTGTFYQHTWSNVSIPSQVDGTTGYIGLVGSSGLASTGNLEVTGWEYTVNTPTASPSSTVTSAGAPTATNPTFSPAPGSYAGTQAVAISSSGSSNICYALGGSGLVLTPLADQEGHCAVGTLYSGPVSVSSSQTLYAVAGLNNTGLSSGVVQGAYTIGTVDVNYSPGAGTYTGTQSVSLSSPTPGAYICYTLSAASSPTLPATNTMGGCTTGTLYTGPVSVASSSTLYAMAGTTGGAPSPLATATYTITAPPAGTATGDSRTISEPLTPFSVGGAHGIALPQGCQQILATKTIAPSSSICVDPFNATAGSGGGTGGTGTQGTLGATGCTSLEPNSESSDYSAVYTRGLAASPANHCVQLSSSGSNHGFVMPPFSIPSGVTLVVDPGVTVFASRVATDYGSSCGGVGSCSPWITSANTKGSGVMGDGILDMRGWDKFSGNSSPSGFYYARSQTYCNNHGGAEHGYPNCTPATYNGIAYGPNAFNIVGSSDFTIYRITIKDSAQFNINCSGCNGFTAYDVTIKAPHYMSNTDGFDCLNSTNCTYTHGRVSNGDNQMACKSTTAATSNISFTYNSTYGGIAALCGTDQAGGINNVLVDHIIQDGNLLNDESAGIGLGSSMKNGGPVKMVTFSNICMRNEHDSLRFFTSYGGQKGSKTPDYTGLVVKDVHVLASTAPYTTGKSGYFTFQGLNAANPIVASLSNIKIEGTNQGVEGANSPNSDQYLTAALSGYIDPTLGTQSGTGQFGSGSVTGPASGPGVSTSGSSAGSPTWSVDPCTAMTFQPLYGHLVATIGSQSNLESYTSTSGSSVNVTLQATVATARPVSTVEGAALGTGPITFKDTIAGTTTTVGTGTIGANGMLATLSLSGVGPGTHVYTATYPSDSNYSAFTFGNVVVTVSGCGSGCAAAPTFSPVQENFSTSVSVTLSDSSPSPTIYYTTNGSTPTTSSSVYSSPISITATTVVNAMAASSGLTNSSVSSATYTLNPAATPVMSPATESFSGTVSVTITDSTASPTIYYTTDDSTPTTSSSVYTTPISISATTIIKAIATASGYAQSAVAKETYTLTAAPTVATPVADPIAGTYFSTQPVALTDSTSGASICYAIGSAPTAATAGTCDGSTYSGPISVSSTETIETLATKAGMTNSPVASFAYVISTPTPGDTGDIEYTQIKEDERLGPGDYFQMANKGTYSAVNTATPCNSTNEGATAAIQDSTTATYGATIAGSGSNHVHAYCNGTNWVVD